MIKTLYLDDSAMVLKFDGGFRTTTPSLVPQAFSLSDGSADLAHQ